MKYVFYVAITFRVHAGAVSIGHDLKGFGCGRSEAHGGVTGKSDLASSSSNTSAC